MSIYYSNRTLRVSLVLAVVVSFQYHPSYGMQSGHILVYDNETRHGTFMCPYQGPVFDYNETTQTGTYTCPVGAGSAGDSSPWDWQPLAAGIAVGVVSSVIVGICCPCLDKVWKKARNFFQNLRASSRDDPADRVQEDERPPRAIGDAQEDSGSRPQEDIAQQFEKTSVTVVRRKRT